jgi:hypothetical protein
MIGAVTKTNHAPWLNLTTEKIRTTNNETDPDKPLITNLTFQEPKRCTYACFAMPNPANVNPVNTPSA